MHNCQVICAKYFKPTSYLSSGLFEVAHPRYCSIASTQQDRLTIQVKEMHYSNEFFPCYAEVLFVSIETFTVISNDYFATFLKLGKHSSSCSVRCVCV
ncbi:hypothetical protein DPMN_135283 [Dreissena polymorpha]|uniref:Uncharacterized protein n=1 Tax=Dreissena polymorpha TaxID=45954 RepID=A0A9D4G1J2_DREPO|nr:hypothetical protein DPMN_135283 [Dreissena polymorpha]